jgi:serine/threonine-protein kinase HipA
MMISDSPPYHEAYVWVWLPKQIEPIVAGRIVKENNLHYFTYSRHYRENPLAIPFSPFELPLKQGTFQPEGLNTLHSCLRDAAPDAWGRRVINYRHPAMIADELDYLLVSGSNRIGALDFQISASEYQPRNHNESSLDDLLLAAQIIDKKQPLPPELDIALLHGTSVGGARPKALVSDQHSNYIAKFASSTDSYDIVKAEYIVMQLAGLVGIDVAETRLISVLGKDVLLVERFDRQMEAGQLYRRSLLSGLSLLGLNEMEARYASYRDLADLIRHHFINPKEQLEALFKRLVFNILTGNTDDHARNHAAFWDGKHLSLTPAYDLCPQPRTGNEASQAMQIGGEQGNLSTLSNALSVCTAFMVEEEKARHIINRQTETIHEHWDAVCANADLADIEKSRLWQGAVLNPFCMLGYEGR